MRMRTSELFSRHIWEFARENHTKHAECWSVFQLYQSDQNGHKHKKLLCRHWIFLGSQQTSEALYTKITIAVVSGRTFTPTQQNCKSRGSVNASLSCHCYHHLDQVLFSGWEDALAAVESALQEAWKEVQKVRNDTGNGLVVPKANDFGPLEEWNACSHCSQCRSSFLVKPLKPARTDTCSCISWVTMFNPFRGLISIAIPLFAVGFNVFICFLDFPRNCSNPTD